MSLKCLRVPQNTSKFRNASKKNRLKISRSLKILENLKIYFKKIKIPQKSHTNPQKSGKNVSKPQKIPQIFPNFQLFHPTPPVYLNGSDLGG